MSLLIKIRENKNFTENEKICAKYILENYRQIRDMTASEISKKTFVSLATVTRTCKKLSLSGFSEFKLKLLEEIAFLKNNEIEFSCTDIDENNDTAAIIEKLNELSISSLKETKLMQDPKQIDKVSKLIFEKEVIDFYGIGASHIVCLDAEYKFMRTGKQTNTFASYDKQYIQAKNSDDNNLAIIISYSGMTKEMVEIAKILKEKNIETISITMCTENEVAKLCNTNLFVTSREGLKRSAATYSRISMLNLIDVIYMKYSNDNYDAVIKKIGETKIEKI